MLLWDEKRKGKRIKMSKFNTQNRTARITEFSDSDLDRRNTTVFTNYRERGTLKAEAGVRFRDDVTTNRSLTGLTITTSNGKTLELTGREARTLQRLLDRAANG